MANTPPPRTTKLAKYRVRHRITRADKMAQALHCQLFPQAGERNAYALAAELIPKRGVAYLQSAAVRKLARSAFRAARTRQSNLQSGGV